MIVDDLKKIYAELSDAVDILSFAKPTTHVYNPLNYARIPIEKFLAAAGKNKKEVVFLGMNPGPWGMVQTGVPFGEVAAVRDWLGINEEVGKPPQEHPKRPVDGCSGTRSEVSGRRLWGWAQEHFDSPEAFFQKFTIWNFCPLAFLEETGRNRTPDKLPAGERASLFSACDRHLRRVVDIFEPDWVVGIGAFATERAREALGGRKLRIGRILHPSPANPRAPRNWAGQVKRELTALGVRPAESPREDRRRKNR